MSKMKLIPFHEGQEKIVREFVLDDSKKFGIVNVGRQWGKSLMAMNVMIGWMMQNPNSKGGWITPYAKHWQKAFRDIKSGAHQVISSSNKMDGIIRFASGSELQFLSTENEDGVRGFTFDYVIVDEAGFVKQGAFDNLAPTWGVQGKKVLFISTPGIKNWYYKQFMRGLDDNIKNAISFTASSYDNPFYDNDEIDGIKATTPKDKFKQEYLAEFSDASGGVFVGYDGKCRVEDYVKASDEICFAGIDIARGGEDFTSIVIMNATGKVLNRESWQEWDTDKQIRMIVDVLKPYSKLQKVVVETNQEIHIYQELKRLLLNEDVHVVGFQTTRKNKPPLIQNLVSDIEQGHVILPTRLCDEVMFDEFGNFGFEKKEDGYIKYAGSGQAHDDSVMSCAFANEARQPDAARRKPSFIDVFNKLNPEVLQ